MNDKLAVKLSHHAKVLATLILACIVLGLISMIGLKWVVLGVGTPVVVYLWTAESKGETDEDEENILGS